MTTYSNTHQDEKERKDTADYDYTENGLDDRARCAATDSGGASLRCQPVTTRN